MVEEIDIYRSAKLLIDQHGQDASIETAQRADAMLERGDLEGQMVWIKTGRAIEELQTTAGKRH